ncbi:hypothetical protein BFS34_003070 [Macrococcoides caseolyticum subsp. hominis]|uniref:hypothetical protein n=1 Tax=Macrococcoides caseolyticum TaxID=69966 RepID=UPI000C15DB6A|nr:hypothetical protein [Macrococcus caseolyticus]RAI81999.1 hypothetical protein BFS34_003070 [Macrococcus caseolyticus subsp. hominis]
MINVGDILADDYETYLVKALNKTRTHAILKCVSEDSIPEESYPITSLDTKGSAIMGCDLGNTYNEISFLAHEWFIKYEQQKQRVNKLEKQWNGLKDFVSEEYRKTSIMQEIYSYYEVIKEIERIEKENEG